MAESPALSQPPVRLVAPAAPGLLDAIAVLGLGWASVTVVVGVAAGVTGVFNPYSVLMLGAAGGVLLAWPVWKRAERRPVAADVLVVLLVIGWVIFNSFHAAQHMFPGSDPGVYLGTGWWMAGEPSPLIEMAPGILDATDGSFGASGFYDTGEASLAPQFPRGLPVVLAMAKAVGGAGAIFVAPILIGGAALLAVYLLASLFVSRWWSLLAAASLAANFVVVHFSRDAYAEPLALLFLFGGSWLLLRSLDDSDRRAAAVAGFVLGAALCVRIDALIAMSVLPLLVLHFALLTDDGRQQTRRIGLAGLVVFGVALVALADLALLDSSYLEAQGSRLAQVLAVVAALTVLATAIARWPHRLRALVQARAAELARVVVALLTVGLVYAFVVRPLGPPGTGGTHAFLEEVLRREGVADFAGRTMVESTGLWLWWYLGPLLVAGLAGLVTMARRTVRQPDPAGTLLFGLVFGTGLVYLWRPSVIPLHPWAMRRFLPVVIPGIVVLGVWWLAGWAARPKDRRIRIGAGLGAVAIALTPLLTLAPIHDTTEQRGAHSFVEGICDELPSDAALFSDSTITSRQWGPALRIYCDLPVVLTTGPILPELMTAASQAYDVLWFGSCPLPGEILVSRSAQFPITEFTATRAPDRLVTDFFGIEIARPSSFRCPAEG